MSSIYDWSTVADNNGSADGDMTWAEGMAPSAVNNSSRQLVARVAELLKDIGGSIVAGGTANGLTVVAGSGFTTYANGRIIAFRAASNNTGATTLNVNGIGSKSLRYFGLDGEAPVAAGMIRAGGVYIAEYSEAANGSAGAWILLNPSIYDAETAKTDVANTWTAAQTLASGSGISSSGNSILDIKAGTNLAYSILYFSDPDAGGVGRIWYQHNADRMYFMTAGVLRATLTEAGDYIVTGNITAAGNPVATVYTGSNAAQTNYPIGTTITVFLGISSPNSNLPALNSVIVPRLPAGVNGQFVTQGSSTPLVGVWRVRGGFYSLDTEPGGYVRNYVNVERTAS